MIPGQIQHRIHVPGERPLGNILGHVNQHRARPTGRGDVIGLADDPGQVVGLLHQEIVFHHRHRDAENIRLLERVLAEHPGYLLPANHHHRHAVHLRCHEAGHGVAGSRPRGHQHGGGPTGRAGVAIGHVHRTLLVPNQDELEILLDRLERIKDRQRGTTRVTENVFNAKTIQSPDEGLCSIHLRCFHENWLSGRKFEQFKETCNQNFIFFLEITHLERMIGEKFEFFGSIRPGFVETS